MRSYWFGDMGPDGCHPARGNVHELVHRFWTIRTDIQHYIPAEWRWACESGVVRDREDYLSTLRELALALAGQTLTTRLGGRDQELLQMVAMIDELDEVINLLTERAVEWYRVRNPSFSRKYRSSGAKPLLRLMKSDASDDLKEIILEIERLGVKRTALVQKVSAEATGFFPNCSAIVGGLVAARIIAAAGGIARLTRLPAGSIQVLGARTALFAHLQTGSPPPKHGIIYQHRRVHNAPGKYRGRVARVIAAKLGIASRIDFYRGSRDEGFLARAEDAIRRSEESP